MTEEIVASCEGVGKDAFGFLRDAVESLMSSPEARAALSSRENFMAFERGTQRALWAGASSLLTAAGASESVETVVLSETMCCGIDGTGVPVRPGELSES